MSEIWRHPFSLEGNYYPLVPTTFWIECHLWKLDPFGYHLNNLFLHLLNASLLGIVLSELLIPGAWLAAAIFALHPVHVESVAWIAERKNVLFLFFSLLAFLSYFRFSLAESARRARSYYLLSLSAFIFAVISKPTAATFPLITFILIARKKGRADRRDILPLLIFLAIGAGLALFPFLIEGRQVAQSGSFNLSLIDRSLIAGKAIWFYLGKIFWPVRLSFIYPAWKINAHNPFQYLPLASAILLAVTLWIFRRRIGTGPFVAFAFFVISLAPTLGFFDINFMRYSFVADHWQYQAAIGPIALTASFLSRRKSRIFRLISGMILISLGILTWKRGVAYQDNETIWKDTLAKNPDAAVAEYNLGADAFRKSQLDDALKHYSKAIEMKSDYAEAHNNLAVLWIREGKFEKAEEESRAALRIWPDYLPAHANLGVALARLGKSDEAIKHFSIVSQAKPDDAASLSNLKLAEALRNKSADQRRDSLT